VSRGSRSRATRRPPPGVRRIHTTLAPSAC
jgi:hypothetical protein